MHTEIIMKKKYKENNNNGIMIFITLFFIFFQIKTRLLILLITSGGSKYIRSYCSFIAVYLTSIAFQYLFFIFSSSLFIVDECFDVSE